MIATTFWGVVGLLVGLTIALQLTFPVLNLGLEWTSFGRLATRNTALDMVRALKGPVRH